MAIINFRIGSDFCFFKSALHITPQASYSLHAAWHCEAMPKSPRYPPMRTPGFPESSHLYNNPTHSHCCSIAKHAARNTGTAGHLLFLVWKQQARHPHPGCCTVPMNGSFACGSQSGNCAANCPHPRYGIGTMIVSGCLQLQSGHPPHPQSWRAAKGYLRAVWTPDTETKKP